ncbi:11S globulin seed storage protein 2-like [Rutidosis leptorrhynchoides]|uniref:11S globulin seed storage protein 2-like n=1 Tax=Rutidosis leptorrhynchoides TaxID=125765 RepID=UPI003A9A6640
MVKVYNMTKVALILLLLLLVHGACGLRECWVERIAASKPSQRIQAEGGVVDFWEENEEQFRCAGVSAMRIKMHPETLTMPKYHSAPLLIFVKQGMGVMGVTFAGSPETYQSSQPTRIRKLSRRDQHQKIHRIRQGDLIAIPAGAAYWCYNDGEKELATVSVFDLNNQANQLDQKLRTFFLAGGISRSEMLEIEWQRGSKQMKQNLFNGFETEILADVFDVSTNLVRVLQEDTRGAIVNVGHEMRMIRPDDDEEEESWYEENENYCTTRIKQSMDTHDESDIVVRKGGRVHLVDHEKLPILRSLGMSAERGRLMPNAMITPHWSTTENRAVYVTRGEAHVEIVDNFGKTIMDEIVKEGDMFVLPQFFAVTAKAINKGYEWITFKSSSQPKKSPMISVIKAMPIHVLTNAYNNMSPIQAQELKWNRGEQTMILSPSY